MGHNGSLHTPISLSMSPTSHLCGNYRNDIIFPTSMDHFPRSQDATFPNARLGSESLDNKKTMNSNGSSTGNPLIALQNQWFSLQAPIPVGTLFQNLKTIPSTHRYYHNQSQIRIWIATMITHKIFSVFHHLH